MPADITRQPDVDALVARTLERFGRIDMLVNNAGRSARGEAIATTPEEFAELVDLNLIALVRCTRCAMPHLLASRGHLVNIGSLAGKTAARYMGAYSASKFAVSAYSQQLRLELGSAGAARAARVARPDRPRRAAGLYNGTDGVASAERAQAGRRRESRLVASRRPGGADRKGLRASLG